MFSPVVSQDQYLCLPHLRYLWEDIAVRDAFYSNSPLIKTLRDCKVLVLPNGAFRRPEFWFQLALISYNTFIDSLTKMCPSLIMLGAWSKKI